MQTYRANHKRKPDTEAARLRDTQGWYKPDPSTGRAHRIINKRTGACLCGYVMPTPPIRWTRAMHYTPRCTSCSTMHKETR